MNHLSLDLNDFGFNKFHIIMSCEYLLTVSTRQHQQQQLWFCMQIYVFYFTLAFCIIFMQILIIVVCILVDRTILCKLLVNAHKVP